MLGRMRDGGFAMTYKEINAVCAGKTFPLSAKNSDGENIIIERGKGFFRLTTAQHNGWARINTVYEDGTSEETYSKRH